MAMRKKSRPSATASDRRAYVPPLPHSSWRLATAGLAAGSAAPLASASEFWDKLGL